MRSITDIQYSSFGEATTLDHFKYDQSKIKTTLTGVRHSENLVFRVNLHQNLLKSLIIRQYYCVFHLRFGNKFTPTKLQRTRKRMIFLEEKAKSHGNADAYRGFLTHYYGKSAVFGQFLTMAHTRMSGTHCAYVDALDEEGKSVFGKMVLEFINEY